LAKVSPYFLSTAYIFPQSDLTIFSAVAYYNMVGHPSASKEAHEQTASYNGLMHFVGEIQGKKGSIVFISTGTYTKETGALCDWVSDPKTGTEELAGLKAHGWYKAPTMVGEAGLVID
jgi:hypothetical protein